jgi:tripartite-type tricarboxylate transporter receptor subunit TctC
MVLRLLAVAMVVVASHAAAQEWPARPIHVVIPFGAGSATDIVPRIAFEQLTLQLGQPLIVENRLGAGGTIATGSVAKADPDGYTLLATSNAHTIAPAMFSNLTYDASADFAAVIPFGTVPNVLIISPSKGIKTVQELVAAAKAKPGVFNYGSVGVGSATHLSIERFRLSAGIDLVHIPFKGGPEALTEVIAGRVELYFCPINTALPYIREGRLMALAVNGFTRAAELPIWLGMLAPAKTPRAIVEKLHRETAKALQVPTTQEKLAKNGVEPLVMTPAEFDARVKADIAANGALVKAAGIKIN